MTRPSLILAAIAPDTIVAVWLLFVVLGLLLLVRGYRGKKTDNCPLCRRCGYDLSGCSEVSTCPECGNSVAVPKGRRIGRRRRQRGLWIAGAVLLFLCALSAGVARWADSANFDWNTAKPFSVLLSDAQRTDKTMDGMHNTPADRALAELTRRFNAGDLSRRQTAELVSTGLAIQVDPALCWLERWGEIIESARTRGQVTDPQWAAYLANSFQGCGVQLATAPDPGKTILNARVGRPRCAQQSRVQWSLLLEHADIGGSQFTLRGSAPWRPAWSWTPPRHHEVLLTPPADMVAVRTSWTLGIKADDLTIPERHIEQVQKLAVQRPRSVQRPGGPGG